MAAEFRVFGPPGTGKTTFLINQLTRAAEKYRPEEIYLCSFSRAAAHEIASRALVGSVERSNIGTIHALSYRQLGHPTITEGLLDDWNARHGNWAIHKSRDLDMPAAEQSGADLLQEYQNARCRGLTPRNENFAEAWESFKAETNSMDFTDLLLQAPEELPGCKVLLLDEAQDCNPVEWRVVRKWAETVDTFVAVGDDDQTIYGFQGADPASFLSLIPDENRRVLSQSYRLPRRIHAMACRWIGFLGSRRAPKVWAPRDAEGEISRISPDRITSTAIQLSKQGSVMVLASCGYMLNETIESLRAAGVPFHNPHRKANGRWNPLGCKATLERLLSFRDARTAMDTRNRHGETTPETWGWVQLLRSKGLLAQGLKARFAQMELGDEPPMFDLPNEAMVALCSTDWTWLRAHLLPEHARHAEYLIRVIEKEKGARPVPKIVVGTVHAVKGAEATSVILMPDISRAAAIECENTGQAATDAVRRLFYVGLTRAKERLVLVEPSTRFYAEI